MGKNNPKNSPFQGYNSLEKSYLVKLSYKTPFKALCCLLNNVSNVENKTMRKQNYKKTELGNNHVHNVYALLYTKFFSHRVFTQSFYT